MKIIRRDISFIVCIAIILACFEGLSINAQASSTAKSFKNFKSVKKYYEENSTASYVYYNNITLKTKKGTQKHMAVAEMYGAYMTTTKVYTKSGNKIKQVNDIVGSICYVSSNKNYFIAYQNAGSGYRTFLLYKYNKKSGKYKEVYKDTFNTISENKTESGQLNVLYSKNNLDPKSFKHIKPYKNQIK